MFPRAISLGLAGMAVLLIPATAADGQSRQQLASARDAAALERALETYAGTWADYRYDPRSLRNVRIVGADRTSLWVQGDYTYNGGSPEWVRGEIRGGLVHCLQYQSGGGCTPVGRSQWARKAVAPAPAPAARPTPTPQPRRLAATPSTRVPETPEIARYREYARTANNPKSRKFWEDEVAAAEAEIAERQRIATIRPANTPADRQMREALIASLTDDAKSWTFHYLVPASARPVGVTGRDSDGAVIYRVNYIYETGPGREADGWIEGRFVNRRVASIRYHNSSSWAAVRDASYRAAEAQSRDAQQRGRYDACRSQAASDGLDPFVQCGWRPGS